MQIPYCTDVWANWNWYVLSRKGNLNCRALVVGASESPSVPSGFRTRLQAGPDQNVGQVEIERTCSDSRITHLRLSDCRRVLSLDELYMICLLQEEKQGGSCGPLKPE